MCLKALRPVHQASSGICLACLEPLAKRRYRSTRESTEKAVRMISGLKGTTYEEKCQEIGLETLKQRRDEQDLLQTFRILKNKETFGEQELLVRNRRQGGAATHSTTDPWSLMIPRSRLEIRKNSFTARAPELWNKIPADVRACENLKMFKNAMKKSITGMGGGPQENQ